MWLVTLGRMGEQSRQTIVELQSVSEVLVRQCDKPCCALVKAPADRAHTAANCAKSVQERENESHYLIVCTVFRRWCWLR